MTDARLDAGSSCKWLSRRPHSLINLSIARARRPHSLINLASVVAAAQTQQAHAPAMAPATR